MKVAHDTFTEAANFDIQESSEGVIYMNDVANRYRDLIKKCEDYLDISVNAEYAWEVLQ